MKKFITTEILPDILNDLAEKFLENCDKVAIDIRMVRFTNNCRPTLEVKVLKEGTWEVITDNKYDLIEKVHDGYDVLDETIEDALTQL